MNGNKYPQEYLLKNSLFVRAFNHTCHFSVKEQKKMTEHLIFHTLTTVSLGAVIDLSLFSMVNQLAQICNIIQFESNIPRSFPLTKDKAKLNRRNDQLLQNNNS